jgi:recombination associated protein RdgC
VKEKVEEIEAEQSRKVYKKNATRSRMKSSRPSCRAHLSVALRPLPLSPQAGSDPGQLRQPETRRRPLSTLREVIGTLPVRPLTVKISPTATMTDWVTRKPANDFYVLDECELRDTHEDGGIVRCKRQDLTSEEIKLHMSTGKVVTQISLAWQDKLSFALDDKWSSA